MVNLTIWEFKKYNKIWKGWYYIVVVMQNFYLAVVNPGFFLTLGIIGFTVGERECFSFFPSYYLRWITNLVWIVLARCLILFLFFIKQHLVYMIVWLLRFCFLNYRSFLLTRNCKDVNTLRKIENRFLLFSLQNLVNVSKNWQLCLFNSENVPLTKYP